MKMSGYRKRTAARKQHKGYSIVVKTSTHKSLDLVLVHLNITSPTGRGEMPPAVITNGNQAAATVEARIAEGRAWVNEQYAARGMRPMIDRWGNR
jgi:hypothetical protein